MIPFYFDAYQKSLCALATRLQISCGANGPPYDPYLVAEFLKVRVSKARLEGLEGYVEKQGPEQKSWHVVLSAAAPRERQRFTLSHELGHVLLMRAASCGFAPHLRRYRTAEDMFPEKQDPAEEALCNAFAEEFLMPTEDFDTQLAGLSVTPDIIISLTNRYQVSIHALARKTHRIIGKERMLACTLWDLKGRWPLTRWWIGVKSRFCKELARLEELVTPASNHVDTWKTYNGRNHPVTIQVSPVESGRFVLMFVFRGTRGHLRSADFFGSGSRKIIDTVPKSQLSLKFQADPQDKSF